MKKISLIWPAVFMAVILLTGCSKSKTAVPVNQAPQAVTLKVTDSTAATVDLAWTGNRDEDFALYRLYRTNGFVNYLVKTISDRSDTVYHDSLLSPSHVYSYFVSVADTGNLSSQSNLAPVHTLGIDSLILGMDPRSLETTSGRAFGLEVWVQRVDSLFGASFELAYDSLSLAADSAKAGTFLGSDVVFFSHTEPGLASVSVTLKSGAAEVSGSGGLAVVYFHSTGTGNQAITFSPTTALRRANGSDVPGFSSLSKWKADVAVQ